jgi:hypothetical protein
MAEAVDPVNRTADDRETSFIPVKDLIRQGGRRFIRFGLIALRHRLYYDQR